jgi:hypothetical protein
MKARYLKSLLGTKRPVTDDGEKVCVGSSMVHDLISVDKKTLQLRYALGYPGRGRDTIKDAELLAIWDKLQSLIDSGEMKAIIEENDVIENPITVYTYDREFKIVESLTDAVGYPNVTYDGKQMYNNTHFADINDARREALKEARACHEADSERILELTEKIEKIRRRIHVAGDAIVSLTKELEGGKA